MFQLPSPVFRKVLMCLEPKSIFANKRICSKWNEQAEDKYLLKSLVKMHHPNVYPILEKHEYKSFMEDITKQQEENRRTFSLNDFEFLINIYRNDEFMGKLHWEGNNSFVPKEPWMQFNEFDLATLKAKLFIFLKDENRRRIQFRSFEFVNVHRENHVPHMYIKIHGCNTKDFFIEIHNPDNDGFLSIYVQYIDPESGDLASIHVPSNLQEFAAQAGFRHII